MPADRLLGTLLRSLQTYTDQQDTPRLLGTASSLLTTLNNPLNVTLLTSQLLSAPAIWTEPEGLRTSVRCLSAFHSATQALVKHEHALREKSADADFADLQLERTLPKNEWVKAVISGADDHSRRWRHLLALGGLLLGFGSPDDGNLSSSMRSTIESALVTAANLALDETPEEDQLGLDSITLVLNHAFPYVADHERAGLTYDSLLPVLIRSVLHSGEGLRSGYFLGSVDQDVRQVSNDRFQWPEQSRSFQQIQAMLNSPIVSSLGPLSRLIGHAIEQVDQPWLVSAAMEEIVQLTRNIHLQWRQTKLSEIDASEENLFLDQQTLGKTVPQLWKLLRSLLFAIVIMLRSITGRMLWHGALANDEVAPKLAAQALHVMRNLYFAAVKTGSASFSQYTFAYLTAMDALCAYPPEVEAFLQSIRPAETSGIPQHPLDRNLDLFFLNTAEHFTFVASPKINEDLLAATASRYLVAGESNHLLPIFEAAHSGVLAVFSAPQNADITRRHLPFYIDALFGVFPEKVSARQFRLAFRTLLRLTSPPAVLAASEPMLSATLLELLNERALNASSQPLPPKPAEQSSDADPPVDLSEQAVLVLTVIDTLPQLSLELLDEWLPLAAQLVNRIEDPAMREHCKEYYWHTLVGGEMDPDRSGVCHDWWSTRGGREMLLFGESAGEEQDFSMSGALPDEARESKL
ncbi:uncharacterized protein LTR77_001618 [Saxophila tyrrhenica]|uniref:Peroxisomal membrane protein PEX17 n=1 Tax=Saxophila tyrrhenica TaxID=1690608 RepID=A0AAV9PKX5_9PEZI|nr:hypothetical protein LTR77_001618 [Saxophila tyrrhenica]